jgi:uncharacterized membrane protein
MSEVQNRRLASVDMARGLALLAMFLFHFIWDLGYFRYIDPSVPYSLGVRLFGHSIAFSFLFIAGVSLVLAHGGHPRWPLFWRRFAIIGAAAALVSAGTYLLFPDAFVFFGILHCIAAASLLSAPFLLLPWSAALAAAALAVAAPFILASSFFDSWPWWWTGLSTFEPSTNDYRPLLPWGGAMLAGVAAAKAVQIRSALARAPEKAGGSAPLIWLGRHSLLLYLAHQPAFFAAFSLLALLAQPPKEPQSFAQACQTQCEAKGADPEICRKTCACTEEEAARSRALSDAFNEEERARRVKDIARQCVAKIRAQR